MALNLTSIERKAVAKILFEIANVEGKISDGDVLYFKKIQSVLGISNSEIEETNFMSVTDCCSIIKRLLLIDKDLVAIMMLEMINSDGHIVDKEMSVFEMMGSYGCTYDSKIQILIAVCVAAELPLPKLGH